MIDFIQLGANIGKSYSDIMWWLVPQEGWSGIFVEPNPDAYEKLIECYADLENCFFEKVAIGPKLYEDDLETERKVDKIIMELGNPDNYHETSHRARHQERNKHISNPERYIQVPNMTLDTLVEKYNMTGKPFELLQVDIENSDYNVMITTDLSKVRPRYIRIETIHMENINCLEGETCQIFPDTCAPTPSSQKAHLDKFMQLNGYKMIDDPWYKKYVELTATDFPGKEPEKEHYNTTYFKETL
jgi:FkbM family methyltransferase